MTASNATFGEARVDFGLGPRQSLLWLLPWGVALAFGAWLESSVQHGRPALPPSFFTVRSSEATSPVAPRAAAGPYGALVDVGPYGALVDFTADAKPATPNPEAYLRAAAAFAARAAGGLPPVSPRVGANPYGGLADFFADRTPLGPSRDLPLRNSLDVAQPAVAVVAPPQDVPLPPKRDSAALEETTPLPPARPAELAALANDATPPADNRNVFQKLFGIGAASSPVVAYAEPESRVVTNPKGAALAGTDRSSGISSFGRTAPIPGYDQLTAVYDITARTVYLPDGTRLEAHSGLGDRLDDPRYVSERARGATPPHLYELTLREDLFHGVQALRLTPIGDGDVFGRAGLLAHPFMLGPNGDSNGCVSVRDYDAFLKAYQDGRIKRLAVVARLN
jgi:hypothetical protein